MNAEQRKRLSQILEKLNDCMSEIEEIRDEEEEKYDNLPDSLRDGEKGDRFQENIGYLEDADSYISDCIDALDSIE